jgi:hypothetical protein
MKFAAVWADIANQNLLLRFVIATLSLVVITLSVLSTKLALKEPVVIERACQTSERLPANASQSAEEIKGFVKEVLLSRFNSGAAPLMAWMAPDQARQRKIEQDELEKRRLAQKIVIEEVEVTKSGIRAIGDRILSIGKVRSAFPFVMDVTLETTARSGANPYGLVLTRVQPVADSPKAGGEHD